MRRKVDLAVLSVLSMLAVVAMAQARPAVVDYEIGSEISYDKNMEVPFHSLQAVIRGAEQGNKGESYALCSGLQRQQE